VNERDRWWMVLLVASISGIPACPSDHPGPSPTQDADLVDAALGDRTDGAAGPIDDGGGLVDALTPPMRADAAIPNDEPDVPPDARPSDDPSSSAWVDPPVIGPDQDCCSTSARVDLASDDADLEDAAPVLLAWTGDEWAVVWGGPHVIFRRLDRNAQPTTARRIVDGTGGAFAIGWGHHELALARGYWPTPEDSRVEILFLDREGVSHGAQPIRAFLETTSIVRHAAIHGWVSLAHYYHSGDLERRSIVTMIDGQPPAEIDLGRIDGWRSDLAIAVPVASRLVSVEPSQFITTVRTFANAAMVPSRPLMLDLGSSSSAARLRDTVVIVVQPETGGTQGLVFDPFTNAMIGAPTMLSGIGGELRMAGDDIGGTVGVCYNDGNTLRFGLLGPDGARLGRTIELSHGYNYPPTCAIGTSEQDEFVVAWYGQSVMLGPIHATTVHVNR